MTLRPSIVLFSLALALLGPTGVVAAPPGGGTQRLTGSGAPFVRQMLAVVAGAQHLHIRSSVEIRVKRPDTAPRLLHTTLDVAWAPGNRFHAESASTPRALIVGTGHTTYIYYPDQNRYTVPPEDKAAAFASYVRSQATVLSPQSPTAWQYLGVRTIQGYSCDLVVGHGNGSTETLYLDRHVHLPRKVVTTRSSNHSSTSIEAEFTTLDVNHPLPDRLFRFTPPAGVHRMDAPSRSAE